MDAAHSLLPFAATLGAIRCRVLLPLPAGQPVRAFLRGIELGGVTLAEHLPAGAELAVPIPRLPLVDLPAELRFAAADEGPDLSPPWPLPNDAAALGLVGTGDPVAEAVRLDAGILRGVLRNRVNGLLRPTLYARINEVAARGVAVDPPTPLPEGGALWRFALPLEAGDLIESGLLVDLFLVGLPGLLCRVAWGRLHGEEAGALPALEAQLARLEGAAPAMEARLEAALGRRLDLQAKRIDAFIEAAAALLLDRVAAAEAPAALRSLAGLDAPPPAPPPSDSADVPIEAGQLALGWHRPEHDGGGPFRWMSDSAVVVNPAPERAVAEVVLRVRHLFGARSPLLAVRFDDADGTVEVEPDGAGYVVTLRPASPTRCDTVRLDALASGVPALEGGGPDPRRLSIAVGAIAFRYAPPDSVSPA